MKINAKGLSCPKPVLKTKDALSDLSDDILETVVDNKIALTNLEKLVNKLGYKYETKKVKDDYKIIIYNEEKIKSEKKEDNRNISQKSILFTNNKMGKGNDELGEVLINGYIYTLTQMDEYPKVLMFVNNGVKLTTGDSKVIEDLKILEDKGVEILTCGTCLDFLDIDPENLKVGSVTNMYSIVDNTLTVDSTIQIG